MRKLRRMFVLGAIGAAVILPAPSVSAHPLGHPHPHPHPHSQRVAIRHRVPQWRSRRLNAARNDPNFVVTNHAHGGASHTHVLPAPGAKVSRRQLVSMGFAGVLVPMPSALVVLLGGRRPGASEARGEASSRRYWAPCRSRPPSP